MDDEVGREKAHSALKYGLSVLLVPVLIWIVLGLADVMLPLPYWLLILLGIVTVLFGTTYLAGFILWLGHKSGVIEASRPDGAQTNH